MPSIKLNVSGSSSRKASTNRKSEAPSKSRKKRRTVTDDEDEDDYLTPESEEEGEDNIEQGTSVRQIRGSRLRRSMSYLEAPDPDKLFDDDANIDVVNSDIPDRAPTPDVGPLSPEPGPSPRKQRRTSAAAKTGMGKTKGRSRKKATAIYSDDEDEDEYVDAGRRQDDNNDEDFVVNSPPRKTGKKAGTGATGGAKGRGGKAGKEKGGGFGEIMIKDERKLPPSAPASGAGPAGASVGDAKAGMKRRRETVTEANAPTAGAQPSATNTSATQATSSASIQPQSQAKEGAPPPSAGTTQPPSKIRKLPPIKKNKNLAGVTATAPSSGFSTPSVPIATASGSATSTAKGGPGAVSASSNVTSATTANAGPSGLPIVASLPRKPIPKTSDVDLSSPDIYNSLFKTGSSAPRVGVNSRVKEEERRKELMKMRDEARAARLANLQKSTFNLLTPQDKVARFEDKMRDRNSSGIYPNHLGSALKLIFLRRSTGYPIRPFKKAGGASGSQGAGSSGSGSGNMSGAGASQGAGG